MRSAIGQYVAGLRIGLIYSYMDNYKSSKIQNSEWFAIKVRQVAEAEKLLANECDEVLFPKEIHRVDDNHTRVKAIIPHVLFIKTSEQKALDLERAGVDSGNEMLKFWIYRFPNENKIQVIPQSSINLLKLLSADDKQKCQIFNKQEFNLNQKVRVIGGPFKDCEGYVQRVKKNKHVIVKIEGICLLMLPFIHPDLLEPVEN